MQFKVPQNIDMADRVVGPLTLIQFLYLMIGGIVIYFLFTAVAPINSTLFFLLAFPIGFFSFALAFLKIQDQPFSRFVVAFFAFLFRPKSRIWQRSDNSDQAAAIVHPGQEAQTQATVTHKTIDSSQLNRLVKVLDTSGTVSPQEVRQPTGSSQPQSPVDKSKRQN